MNESHDIEEGNVRKAVNVDSMHWYLDQSDLAFEHYNIALKIQQKSFPPQHHPDIALTLNNMSFIYEEKGDLQQALSHFEKVTTIFHHTLHSIHASIIQVEWIIQRASS
jgi:tetratricopeptide (TPR) repeat protein